MASAPTRLTIAASNIGDHRQNSGAGALSGSFLLTGTLHLISARMPAKEVLCEKGGKRLFEQPCDQRHELLTKDRLVANQGSGIAILETCFRAVRGMKQEGDASVP